MRSHFSSLLVVTTTLIALVAFEFVQFTVAQEKLAIYSSIGGYPCTVLANKNGWIGCRSPKDGMYGALWPIDSTQAVDTFDASTSGDKILVFWPQAFSRANFDVLLKSERVVGAILLSHHDTGKPTAFSPDPMYPNADYGCLHPPCTYQWNEVGTNFSYQGYNVPVWAVSDRGESMTIRLQAIKNRDHKQAYPQHGARIKTFMDSGADALTCLTRGDCQYIGGKSFWSALTPMNTSQDYIFSITPIDSNDFFHDLAVGADSTMSSVIANLLAAQALSNVPDRYQLTKQVVFAFFGGEAWGYQGSRQFVDDIINFDCKQVSGDRCSDPWTTSLAFKNITINKISSVIELDQIGLINENQYKLFVHTENKQLAQPIVDTLNQLQQDCNVNINYASTPASVGIPPTSLMSFLRKRPDIPSIVLGGYDATFRNKFYHSLYDDTINETSICNTATLLARTLYKLAGGVNDVSSINANCTFALPLIDCLTNNFSCAMVQQYFYSSSGWDSQPNAYTSVYRKSGILQLTASFVRHVLFDWTATSRTGVTCKSDSDCANSQCIRQECIQSLTYWHEAAPKGLKKDSDGYYVVVDDDESSWTESDWGQLKLELFLIENPVTEGVMLAFGLVEVIVAFVVVFYARRWFAQRFKET